MVETITRVGGHLGASLGVVELTVALHKVFDSPQDNIAEVTAFVKRAHGIRRAGSAALDMAYVAAGRFDGYWEYKLHVWDAAAAVLLVMEAGGRVSFMDGRPYAAEARLNLVVSNGRIHQQMLNVLR